jgi:serine/threonine protein phosphatase PrpC
MYKILLLNNSLNIGTFIVQSSEFVLCVVLEANEKGPKAEWENNLFEELIQEAYKLLPQNIKTSDLPKKMSEAIREILSGWKQRNYGIEYVMYSGFVCIDEMLHACVVGGSRIHLIQNESLIAVTSDHNMKNDLGIDNPIVKRLLSDERTKSIALRGITRYLTDSITDFNPDCYTWKTGKEFSVLLCNKSIHKFENPETYISNIIKSNHLEQPFNSVIIKIDSLSG